MSILLIATTRRFTPSERSRVACSRVCPASEKASSNSSGLAGTTSTAASACAAPVIMLGMKSLCPGASSSTNRRLRVSKKLVPTSIVTPRDLWSAQQHTHKSHNDAEQQRQQVR